MTLLASTTAETLRPSRESVKSDHRCQHRDGSAGVAQIEREHEHNGQEVAAWERRRSSAGGGAGAGPPEDGGGAHGRGQSREHDGKHGPASAVREGRDRRGPDDLSNSRNGRERRKSRSRSRSLGREHVMNRGQNDCTTAAANGGEDHGTEQADAGTAGISVNARHAPPLAAGVAGGDSGPASNSPRSSTGGPQPRAATALPAARPRLSFLDEVDEHFGGGGAAGGAGGGGLVSVATSSGVRMGSGGGLGGGGAGVPGQVNGLAASTTQRFRREEAVQRLSIPPRTITSSMPLPTAMLPPMMSLSGVGGPPQHPFRQAGSGGPHPRLAPPAGGPAEPHLGSASTSLSGPDSFRLGGGAAAVNGILSPQGHAGTAMTDRALTSHGGSPPSAGRTLGRVLFGTALARCARPYMEDRHCIVQCLRPLSSSGQPLQDGLQRCLAAIYDGHNGTRAAETAAARLHMLIAADAALRMHTGEVGPPAVMAAEEVAIGGALRRSFRQLDDQILAEARADGARDGATALLVMRLSDTLYTAHAGDSRAVMSRGGIALRLTEDHKPQLPLEKARVEAAGGRVDFQRCWRVIVEPRDGRLGSGLAVSRSLGDLDFKEPRRFVECEPDVTRLVPVPGDNLIVLASDGLWDVMGDQEAVDCANAALQARYSGARTSGSGTGLLGAGVAYREEDARAAAEALLESAIRRGTCDNVTCVVMLLQWD